MLKGVTWRGGDISIPGGAGCPPPVLVALQTSCSPSWSAFWGLSLGSYYVVGDADGLASAPGFPCFPSSFIPQVLNMDHVWMISLNFPCYVLKLPRKRSAHPRETPRSGQFCTWRGRQRHGDGEKTFKMIQTTSDSSFLNACDLTIHRHR